MKKYSLLLLFLFCSLMLILTIRGNYGSPTEQDLNQPEWKEAGPFELSPERGRYALTYSIVENQSLEFPRLIGKFAAPDVAVHQGKFVSLFAPTLSFITIPGYLFGSFFNLTQVGTFAVVAIFATLNTLLIREIAIKLGATTKTASIAGLTFLFATPAFAYAVNLYQHHISTFLILLSIYSLLKFKGVLSILITFFAFGLSITVDYPNFFLMLPIVIFTLSKFFSVNTFVKKYVLNIHFKQILTSFVIFIPIFLFMLFNYYSYGNPLQLSGTLKGAKSSDIEPQLAKYDYDLTKVTVNPNSENTSSANAVGFFLTRNLLNGINVHLFSADRGILFFTPVMLFGLIGTILAYQKKIAMTSILLGIIGMNILLYSMWTDPWGGWAFGSRYLIPSFAIFSIFLSFALMSLSKNLIHLILFFIIFSYSASVNLVGAITTSANPPQHEASALEQASGLRQKYTFERNIDYLLTQGSKSFTYKQIFSKYINPEQYFFGLLTLILIVTGYLTSAIYTENPAGSNVKILSFPKRLQFLKIRKL